MVVNIKNAIFWDVMHQLLVTANVPSSPMLVTLMMGRYIPPKRCFLQEPLGVIPKDVILNK
jgi:hypothetical protein